MKRFLLFIVAAQSLGAMDNHSIRQFIGQAQRGDIAYLEAALAHCPALIHKTDPDTGFTALHAALWHYDARTAAFLIERGAGVYTKTLARKTARHFIAQHKAYCYRQGTLDCKDERCTKAWPKEFLALINGECSICLHTVDEIGHVYDCGHVVHKACVHPSHECTVCFSPVLDGLGDSAAAAAAPMPDPIAAAHVLEPALAVEPVLAEPVGAPDPEPNLIAPEPVTAEQEPIILQTNLLSHTHQNQILFTPASAPVPAPNLIAPAPSAAQAKEARKREALAARAQEAARIQAEIAERTARRAAKKKEQDLVLRCMRMRQKTALISLGQGSANSRSTIFEELKQELAAFVAEVPASIQSPNVAEKIAQINHCIPIFQTELAAEKAKADAAAAQRAAEIAAQAEAARVLAAQQAAAQRAAEIAAQAEAARVLAAQQAAAQRAAEIAAQAEAARVLAAQQAAAQRAAEIAAQAEAARVLAAQQAAAQRAAEIAAQAEAARVLAAQQAAAQRAAEIAAQAEAARVLAAQQAAAQRAAEIAAQAEAARVRAAQQAAVAAAIRAQQLADARAEQDRLREPRWGRD